jgi:hypothetical protein
MARASFLVRSLVAGMILTAGLAMAPKADAQVFRSASAIDLPGGAGSGRTITGPMLEKYVGVLGFDAAQKDAAKTFHEEYQRKAADGDKIAADARKKMKEMMEDGDHEAAMKKMGEMMGESAKLKSEASVQFLANLKEVLTEAQAPSWERFERLRRRESLGGGGMGFGMASGASVDLTDVVTAVKLPDSETAKIAVTIDQYEREMDVAIKNYQAFQTKQAEAEMKEAKDAKEGGPTINFDMGKMQERMAETLKESSKLRDVNASHVRKLGDALPEEWKKKIEKEWYARAYRRIFGESHTTKQLKTAVGFGDLTAEQKTQVSTMLDAYAKDLDAVNQRWLEEQQKAEADGSFNPLPFMGDETNPEGLKKAQKDRKDLDTRISKQLREVLTEQQRERLPKRQNSVMMPDGMEFIGGDDFVGGGAVEIQVIGPG